MTAFTLRNYNHDGILLNLYGERNEDSCEVQIVTAADSAIDLTELFTRHTLMSMSEMADAQMAREATAQRDDADIDWYELERAAQEGIRRVLQF